MKKFPFGYLAALAVALIALTAGGQVPTSTVEIPATNAKNRQTIVSTAATFVPSVGGVHTPMPGRRSMVIQNVSSSLMYCTQDGSTPLATGGLGIRIAPNEAFPIGSASKLVVRCISVAGQADGAATQTLELQ